ncbi:MAG: hypothetical protein DWH91_12885 [Planctomycetota bacterium]|nr:MAG: hypothetical protein DWH91_12885 [Planctomycetota bacterium]
MAHLYPADLARFIADSWDADAGWDLLPGEGPLAQILSACYQASLMSEEQRPVAFRLLACSPQQLSPDDSPPTGLHRLIFSPSRSFDEQELRRLAPAAEFHRSLIGVHWQRNGDLSIWGIVHSGPRWLQAAHGGRLLPSPLPPSLVICVKGPGQLTVCQGNTTLGMLVNGQLRKPQVDVFESTWLPAMFQDSRREARTEYIRQFGELQNNDPSVIERLTGLLSQHVVRRIISLVRSQRHGGAILFVDPDVGRRLMAANTFLQVKYRFLDEEPRRRFRSLVFRLIHRLQAMHVNGLGITWEQFLTTNDPLVAHLDEAIFELAHMVSGLTGVDGAVLMTNRFELLGFGSEISGSLPEVETVQLCEDAEGEVTHFLRTDGLGTRHRSAFRFCQRFPGSLAIVVSQDGNVRFVAAREEKVYCWDHVAVSFLDV